MRLWSLHPKYLDARGLVALWREALLARAVLRGRTQGYRRHPQLQRFRASRTPLAAVNVFLCAVHREAVSRHYAFDKAKLGARSKSDPIPVTDGQLRFEWDHLLVKLAVRDPARHERMLQVDSIECHPLFLPVAGDVEPWERGSAGQS